MLAAFDGTVASIHGISAHIPEEPENFFSARTAGRGIRNSSTVTKTPTQLLISDKSKNRSWTRSLDFSWSRRRVTDNPVDSSVVRVNASGMDCARHTEMNRNANS